MINIFSRYVIVECGLNVLLDEEEVRKVLDGGTLLCLAILVGVAS